jgi:hypothetical protein
MNATGAPPPSIDGLVRLSRVPAHVGRIDKRPGELVSLRACKSDELKKKKMAKERGWGEMRVAASIMARPRNRATLAHKVISTPTLRPLSAMSFTRSELSLSYSLLGDYSSMDTLQPTLASTSLSVSFMRSAKCSKHGPAHCASDRVTKQYMRQVHFVTPIIRASSGVPAF